AKMQEQNDGFIKIFCRKTSRIVAGAVVVSPHASELIHPLTLAIQKRLTVDELASTFTVFPSLSGSIAEAARRLHNSH
ncbi:MAG: NAD(P)H-quinone dehydrogenase, partial [Actinomycetales bacterium]|nr:NAD(P)H-quinone dehydrogenase [Actinomycetales bacterium]